MADTNLQRTPSSAGDRKTFTWSGWIKRSNLGSAQRIWSAGTSIGTNNNNVSSLLFESNDTLKFFGEIGGSASFTIQTNQVFRDVSAWYHIVLAVDSTQATASNRVKIYVNGQQITSFGTASYMSQNTDTFFNATNLHIISYTGGGFFDGYMSHVNFTDGTAYDASPFGETDTNGQWSPIPAPSVTYGTNGFFLKFASSGSLGTDSSGNGNDFTKNGSGDQVTDTPDNVFATMNPLDSTSATLSEGNLKAVVGPTLPRSTNSTISVSQGKWYFEVKITDVGFGNFGVLNANYNGRYYNASTNPTPYAYTDNAFYDYPGNIRIDGSIVSTVASFTTGDIMGVALNIDDDEITFYKNGSSQGTFSKTFSGNYKIGFSHGGSSSSTTYELNTGNPSFSISSGNSDQNGYGNFEYAPPSGYLALCSQNLATVSPPTIDDGSQYFNTVLYTGNGGTNNITGVGFQPDLNWIKGRTVSGYEHLLVDVIRGMNNIRTNSTVAESANGSLHQQSLDADGFTVAGTGGNSNANGANYVSWNWLAGGTGVTNTNGSITSTVSANTTAGFSIVTYSGNSSAGATVGHGLSQRPEFLIVKRRNAVENWRTQDIVNTATDYMGLNTISASVASTGQWNNTEPTSSVFSLGTDTAVNTTGGTYVAYCFHSVEGYSKFGRYTGNGSTDGTFIYTGFRPAFVLTKMASSTGNWLITDNARNTYNLSNLCLFPNNADSDSSQDQIDMLSNGFKLRASAVNRNSSGGTYIYIAFAENPFVSSTRIPVVAR